jgi:GDP-4-dehydro-6-deoxy-D-mannose reductase
MRGTRILVTGPTGFVGRYLTRLLHADGASVIGAGLGESPELAGELALEAWHPCDVTDSAALGELVAASRPDVVIHLAGQASAAVSFADPIGTFRVNALGTTHLLEAVRRGAPRARLLVVGTSESYGPQPEGTRVTEETPFRPVSPYALSKAAGDAVAEFYARVHGLGVIRTRSFHHLGPGQDPQFALPGFARQIANIEVGRAEPVLRVGNLDVTRDFTDVRDVVQAYARLIESGRPGSAYNVCRGEGIRLSEMVRRLISLARVPVKVEVDPARMRPADVAYLVGDPTAIRNETGWTPTRSVDATLEELLDEWRAKSATDGVETAKSAPPGRSSG